MLINMMWMGVWVWLVLWTEGWEMILTKLSVGVPSSPGMQVGRHPLSILEWMDKYDYILMND